MRHQTLEGPNAVLYIVVFFTFVCRQQSLHCHAWVCPSRPSRHVTSQKWIPRFQSSTFSLLTLSSTGESATETPNTSSTSTNSSVAESTIDNESSETCIAMSSITSSSSTNTTDASSTETKAEVVASSTETKGEVIASSTETKGEVVASSTETKDEVVASSTETKDEVVALKENNDEEEEDDEYEYIEYDSLSENDFLGSEWLVGTNWNNNKDKIDETWVRLAYSEEENIAIWGDGSQGKWAFDAASQFVSISKERKLLGKQIWACQVDDYYYLQGTVRGWTFISPASVLAQFQSKRLGLEENDDPGTAPWFEIEEEKEEK